MDDTKPHSLTRWRDISSDPNSPAVMEWRRQALSLARATTLVADRRDYICRLAVGKRVLDIGVVEHTATATRGPNWLHERLCRVSKTCLGVDVLGAEINQLRERGYNVLCADITAEPLPGTFDLIVCGEILEHLDQPGRLFANIARMLEPDGTVLLTTPNPWYLNVVLRNVLAGVPFSDSADHVAWYDPATLCELAARHDLRLTRFSGVAVEFARTSLGKLILRSHSMWVRLGFRRELFAKTLIYEFALVAEAAGTRPSLRVTQNRS